MIARLAVLVALVATVSCSYIEEALETPEQAAARAERERQATLPISEATCVELDRRASDVENYAASVAAIHEMAIRCWNASAIATASCSEINRRAESTAGRMALAVDRDGGPEAGTLGEVASEALDLMIAELRRRC